MSGPLPLQPSSEHRLIVACARTNLSESGFKLIRDVVAEGVNWDYVLQKALSHGVLPLLYRNLKMVCPEKVPAAVLGRLHGHYLANAVWNHRAALELIKITQLLGTNGIDVIHFKGLSLAVTAYGDPSLRAFGDLDVLVRRNYALKAKELLESAGYRLLYPVDGHKAQTLMKHCRHFALVSDSGKIKLDMHWTLETGKKLVSFSNSEVWDRSETTILDGVPISVPSVRDLLFFLCLHGTNHMWERLIWLSDVTQLIERFPEAADDSLFRLAERLDRKRMPILGLKLAKDVMGAEFAQSIECEINNDEIANSAEKTVINLLFSDEPIAGRFIPFRFCMAMRERTIDKLRYMTERFFLPDEIDFQIGNLPVYAYFLLRPLRLFAGYFAGAVQKFLRN